MRLVVCDYAGHPFQIELSRTLAKRGHAVLHLHFAEFQTPKGAMTKLPDDAPTFAVEGIALGRPFAKDRFVRRRFQEIAVGKLFAARVSKFRPDAVIGCNMPLDAQRQLQKSCASSGIAFIFWLQDIYSAAISHFLSEKLGIAGRAIGSIYRRLEGSILRASDAVIAISDSFIPALDDWGVAPARLTVIHNWASLSEIHPVGKDNEWARQLGLNDRPVALYSGTLGLKHDPALLLELARVGAASGLHVLVISEGKGALWLADQAGARNIDNLLVLPFQPMDIYPRILGTGDMLLAMIGQEAAAFAVPSKILSYLAAGKPIVAAIAADNDAAMMIRAADAGVTTAPGDVAAFVDAVLSLVREPEMRERLGRNARAFAESRFDINAIADRFEFVLNTAIAK